jgi:hypothetical protein
VPMPNAKVFYMVNGRPMRATCGCEDFIFFESEDGNYNHGDEIPTRDYALNLVGEIMWALGSSLDPESALKRLEDSADV